LARVHPFSLRPQFWPISNHPVERWGAAGAFDEFHKAIRQAVENRLETVSPNQS
jgi:hypothetical protein